MKNIQIHLKKEKYFLYPAENDANENFDWWSYLSLLKSI